MICYFDVHARPLLALGDGCPTAVSLLPYLAGWCSSCTEEQLQLAQSQGVGSLGVQELSPLYTSHTTAGIAPQQPSASSAMQEPVQEGQEFVALAHRALDALGLKVTQRNSNEIPTELAAHWHTVR